MATFWVFIRGLDIREPYMAHIIFLLAKKLFMSFLWERHGMLSHPRKTKKLLFNYIASSLIFRS